MVPAVIDDESEAETCTPDSMDDNLAFGDCEEPAGSGHSGSGLIRVRRFNPGQTSGTNRVDRSWGRGVVVSIKIQHGCFPFWFNDPSLSNRVVSLGREISKFIDFFKRHFLDSKNV